MIEKEKKKRENANDRFIRMSEFDASFDCELDKIAGLDEVGRGPLAGPVVVCCILLSRDTKIIGINDSKKLSEKKRNELNNELLRECLAYSIGICNNELIDEINILQATRKAAREATSDLESKIDLLLSDDLPNLGVNMKQIPIISGDALSYRIAAASIVAKEFRDNIMRKLDIKYPVYGFARNKGYGTKEHIQALKEHGPCEIHRMSFLTKILR